MSNAAEELLLPLCDNCNELLCEPYIECVECDSINLCTSCFSVGKEVSMHRNDHDYSIRKNNFPLYDSCNWTAHEEYALLSAIAAHGLGNWEDISKGLQTRSKLECKEHYKKYYIEEVQDDALKLLPSTLQSNFPQPLTPYLYNNDNTEEPPRHRVGSNQLFGGYSAFRSDFELNYDNDAEQLLNVDIFDQDENGDLLQNLHSALINAYCNRLKERHRRYDIIKNHGLIIPRKFTSWIQRYETPFGHPERLIPTMQLLSGMQFDTLVESLDLECEMTMYLMRLVEYRKNGIETFQGARLYHALKKRHDTSLKDQKVQSIHLETVLSKVEDNLGPTMIPDPMLTKEFTQKGIHKRVALPLDISNMPHYHNLSSKEKELCSRLRLMPGNYLEIKGQLITENNKMGQLRLLDARRIIKIDVNKTRKIYDYLFEEGFIKKSN